MWCEHVTMKPHYFVLVTYARHFRTQYSVYHAFKSRRLCACQQERNLKSEVSTNVVRVVASQDVLSAAKFDSNVRYLSFASL